MPPEKHCDAYAGKGEPLARGGRRYRPCKRPATTERTRSEGHWGGTVERTYALCGQHAAQWDKAERGMGYPPRLSSDER